MAGVGRSSRATVSSVGIVLRAARVDRAPSSPTSSAGGWIPRARSRSSTMASLAPRCASSTSWRTDRDRFSPRPRRRRPASPWPSRGAWPARPAGPGCRRAGRARSAAGSPPTSRPSGPAPARATRTRTARASGASSTRMTAGRGTPRRARPTGRQRRTRCRQRRPRAVEEPVLPAEKKLGPNIDLRQAEDGRRFPPRTTPHRVGEAEEGVPPEGEADEDAERGQGTLMAHIGHGAPSGAVAQRRLQPAQEARAGHEGFGILDLSSR
jgi:hypothetical protein